MLCKILHCNVDMSRILANTGSRDRCGIVCSTDNRNVYDEISVRYMLILDEGRRAVDVGVQIVICVPPSRWSVASPFVYLSTTACENPPTRKPRRPLISKSSPQLGEGSAKATPFDFIYRLE